MTKDWLWPASNCPAEPWKTFSCGTGKAFGKFGAIQTESETDSGPQWKYARIPIGPWPQVENTAWQGRVFRRRQVQVFAKRIVSIFLGGMASVPAGNRINKTINRSPSQVTIYVLSRSREMWVCCCSRECSLGALSCAPLLLCGVSERENKK